MKIKVENTKELFDRIKKIECELGLLGGIVQNDMVLTGREEVLNTLDKVDELTSKLQTWKRDILIYMWENEISDKEAEEFESKRMDIVQISSDKWFL